MVIRALYGLKYSSLQFRKYLAETLGNKLGFKSSLIDPDLCYKASTSHIGFEYYSYIIVYVDDIIIIENFPQRYIEMVY